MQHVRHLDPTRMPAERAHRDGDDQCAPRRSAWSDEIGSLEAGKRADIAVFDLDKPYVGVLHRPLSSFVYAGKGSDARAVLVDGEIVYRDGAFAARARRRKRVIAEAEQIGAPSSTRPASAIGSCRHWRMYGTCCDECKSRHCCSCR